MESVPEDSGLDQFPAIRQVLHQIVLYLRITRIRAAFRFRARRRFIPLSAHGSGCISRMLSTKKVF